ncbi:acyltransferase family protein [Bradyrhizobium diazoefficiens]|nr:acyltransferase family protein [Bradyrhizobium diazoefficiens]MBR0703711.1 acyltransferase family protein [Bradyrhizobium diazoefficiens]MBR0772467.1 acyltransferase family protein [Bradyrhizobium diazoefficiens]
MIAIDAIKALAILLVTQSHLKAFYPIRELATGGLLGNCLFFFASSYVISVGLIGRPEQFGAWYVRRLTRIYVPLWTVTLLLVAFRFIRVDTVGEAVSAFVFPGMYWFLPSIALLYVPCYLMICYGTQRALFLSAGATTLAYAITYFVVVDFDRWSAEDHVVLKTLFYFGVMIAAIYLAKFDSPKLSRLGLRSALGLTAAYFLFLAGLKASGLYVFQGGANVLACLWVVAVYKTLSDPRFETAIKTYLGLPVKTLSKLTLHIYLVQVPLIEGFGLEGLAFPLNILIFILILITGASILYRATSFLLGRLPLAQRAVASAS